MKNRMIELTNNDKKSKIVEINNHRIIAKRTFLFTTTMGNNSVGNEIIYDNFEAALKEETEWTSSEK